MNEKRQDSARLSLLSRLCSTPPHAAYATSNIPCCQQQTNPSCITHCPASHLQLVSYGIMEKVGEAKGSVTAV